jgi:hypothetical protein
MHSLKTAARAPVAALFSALASLLFCALAAFAQTPAPGVASKTPAAVVVDVPMLMRGGMAAVEVSVNGQGPFVFAIDTGAAGAARADASLVEKLKLQTVGTMQASDGSGRNARTLDVVRLDSISLGGVQFRDVRAPTRNYNGSPRMPQIDGILGFNLFSEYLLILDYPARRVRLERGELPAADGAEILSFENPRGTPVVELGVGSTKIKAHLDSGNMVGGFILPAALLEKLTLTSAPVSLGMGRTVSNTSEIKEARLKESIRFGRYEYAAPAITFPALSDDANIGASVLRDFALTFDQKNKRLRLDRRERPAAVEPFGEMAAYKDYLGRYGPRTISFEDGALQLQRGNGPKLKLVPLSPGEFTLEGIPAARVKFVKTADGVEIQVLNRDGDWEKSRKEQP